MDGEARGQQPTESNQANCADDFHLAIIVIGSASGVAVAKTHDPAKALDPATSARSSFFLDSIDSTRKKRKREKKLQSQSGAQKEPQHQPRHAAVAGERDQEDRPIWIWAYFEGCAPN